LVVSGAPLIALFKQVLEGSEKEELDTASGLIANDWSKWVKNSRARTVGSGVTVFAYWNDPRNRETYPYLATLFDFLVDIPSTEAACERAFSKLRMLIPKFRWNLSDTNVAAAAMFFNRFDFNAKNDIILDTGFDSSDPARQTKSLSTAAVKHLLGYLLAVEHKNAGGFPDKNTLIQVTEHHPTSRVEKTFVARVTGNQRRATRREEKVNAKGAIEVAVRNVHQIELQLVTIVRGGLVCEEPRFFDWTTLNWTRLCMSWAQVDAMPAAGVAPGKTRNA
jgi:hypothetical protein